MVAALVTVHKQARQQKISGKRVLNVARFVVATASRLRFSEKSAPCLRPTLRYLSCRCLPHVPVVLRRGAAPVVMAPATACRHRQEPWR